MHTDRDDDPNTVHLAAFDGDEVMGVVSTLPEPFPDDPRTAERFHGYTDAVTHLLHHFVVIEASALIQA